MSPLLGELGMPVPLNELERNILDYMVRYLRSNTYQPSIREIGEEFGIKSTKTVSEYLGALAEKGYLERDPSRSRGVRLLGVDLKPDAVSVPCFAQVPDGDAARRAAEPESQFTLDRRLSGPKGSYFLRVRGEQWRSIGIEPEDLLLVEPVGTGSPREGDLVLQGRGGSETLWRFSRRGSQYLLQPITGGDPTVVDDPASLDVAGRVTAIHRRLGGGRIPMSTTAH